MSRRTQHRQLVTAQ